MNKSNEETALLIKTKEEIIKETHKETNIKIVVGMQRAIDIIDKEIKEQTKNWYT